MLKISQCSYFFITSDSKMYSDKKFSQKQIQKLYSANSIAMEVNFIATQIELHEYHINVCFLMSCSTNSFPRLRLQSQIFKVAEKKIKNCTPFSAKLIISSADAIRDAQKVSPTAYFFLTSSKAQTLLRPKFKH